MRNCDVCNKEIERGFCISDSEYFCNEECLKTQYSIAEYNELYEADLAYWTHWSD